MVAGLYSLIATKNLLRILISLEILMKSVTLLIIVVGYITKQVPLAQALVITLIIIEVVSVAVAAGIAVGLFKHHDTLDIRKIRNLKS